MSYDQGYDTSVLQEIRSQNSQLMQTLGQFQLDFDQEIARFEFILSGVQMDDQGNMIRVHDPMLNNRGQAHIMKKVRSWMSKIVAQSNFSSEEIRRWCLSYWEELVCSAYSFGEIWDLDFEEYGSFVRDCVFTLHAMLNQAKDGGLREVIGKVVKVTESQIMTPQSDQKTSI